MRAATRASRAAPLLVLGVAIVAVAHASIFVRLADAAPLAIAAWRLTLASAIVVPLALLFDRGAFARLDARTLGLIAAAGLLLAGHFATWITSLRYTSIANSVVLVTSAPIWVGLIGALTGTLRLSRQMWFAVALSVLGSAVIGWGSARLGIATLRGDLLAIGGAICIGGYLMLAQRIQRKLPFLPFVALVYAAAALFLWITALGTGTQLAGFSGRTWWALAGIALVSQVIGHSGYNWSLRHLNPDIVAVTLLGEPILASLLGLLFFAEPIAPATLAGGVLILAAILVAARAARASAALDRWRSAGGAGGAPQAPLLPVHEPHQRGDEGKGHHEEDQLHRAGPVVVADEHLQDAARNAALGDHAGAVP